MSPVLDRLFSERWLNLAARRAPWPGTAAH
jgi:hypothetical protein